MRWPAISRLMSPAEATIERMSRSSLLISAKRGIHVFLTLPPSRVQTSREQIGGNTLAPVLVAAIVPARSFARRVIQGVGTLVRQGTVEAGSFECHPRVQDGTWGFAHYCHPKNR